MTRAEIGAQVRDILDETSTSVLTDERLARALNRVLAQLSSYLDAFTVTRTISAKANLARYALPNASVGVFGVVSDSPGGVTLGVQIVGTANAWTYVTAVPSTVEPRKETAKAIWSNYTTSANGWASHGGVPLLYGDWVYLLADADNFVDFSSSNQAKVVSAVFDASPVTVHQVSWIASGESATLLSRLSSHKLAKYRANWEQTTVSGVPRAWAFDGGSLILYPKPSADGTLSVYVGYEHPRLSTDTAYDSVPLLFPRQAELALVYGTAAECALILRDRQGTADLAAVYTARFNDEVSRLLADTMVGVHAGTVWRETWPDTGFQLPEP